jgi:hypothetical protein
MAPHADLPGEREGGRQVGAARAVPPVVALNRFITSGAVK